MDHICRDSRSKSFYEDDQVIISFEHVEAIYKGSESLLVYTSSCSGDNANVAFKVLDMKRFIEEYKEWKRRN